MKEYRISGNDDDSGLATLQRVVGRCDHGHTNDKPAQCARASFDPGDVAGLDWEPGTPVIPTSGVPLSNLRS